MPVVLQRMPGTPPRVRRRRGPPAVPPALPRRRKISYYLAAALIAAVGSAALILAGAQASATRTSLHQHGASPNGMHQRPDPGSGGVGAERRVPDLAGPRDQAPDVRYELTARTAKITTDSGRVIDALTYNGVAPGPVLRARSGQLVEVVLHNADVSSGVTIHWHGLDVPNAEDGVAGVTQDAVFPGQEHVYRFRPDQVGTYWYHSHQDAAVSVARGLFGAIIIDPPVPDAPAAAPTELVLVAHTWTAGSSPVPQETTIGLTASVAQQRVSTGERVRLRLINTDSQPLTWLVTGSAFRVTAIDGSPVHQPTDLTGQSLRLAGGGRYDVELVMPAAQVSIRITELNQPGLVLVPGDDSAGVGPTSDPPPVSDLPRFDPLSYGSPLPEADVLRSGPFDRDVEQVLDTKHGRRNGLPTVYWTINDHVYPDIPTVTVRDGDLVRVHIVNRGTDVHPMHLHGHHALVLSRNGELASGSPWWTDTLGVEPGDDFVLAFRADNPGLWMDHCHNLSHAAAGMMMHLSYAGVTTPFSMDHGNLPE